MKKCDKFNKKGGVKVASINRQVRSALIKQKSYNESRHKDKMRALSENKEKDYYTKNKIYSVNTFNTYRVQTTRALEEIFKTNEMKDNDIHKIKEYIPKYLNKMIDEGKSAWSIATLISGFNKLYQVDRSYWEDRGLKEVPKKKVKDIKKNKAKSNEKLRYNPLNYENELVFARISGLRAREIKALKIKDIKYDEKADKIEVYVRNGKGGKTRTVKLLKDNEKEYNLIKDYLEKAKAKKYKKLFPKGFTKELKIHRERATFAKRMYLQVARDVTLLSKEEVIKPRIKELRGQTLDRKALKEVSRALGHNRIDVVYLSYLSK